MKHTLIILMAVLCVAGCKKSSGGGGGGGDTPTEEPQYAPDLYWADDYSGPLGFQIGESTKTKSPRIMLAGVQLYCTGINDFDLFTQSFKTGGNFDRETILRTVETLQMEKVPVVRFSCTPFYAKWMGYYTDNKAEYFETLDYLATCCDQAHILLIPSIFWNTGCLPDYFKEEKSMSAWGDTSSQTYQFMQTYTKEVIDCLKGHKSLAAWEFGNEFNLAADIGIAGYEQMSATCVETAHKGFAEVCQANDPEGRISCSGDAAMRDGQWHLYHERSWGPDSYSQYVEIAGMMTPSPMLGMSEHIYDDGRKFSDLGTMDLEKQIQKGIECAAANGKVYYIGEFTGPHSSAADWQDNMAKHYAAHFTKRVQLSLVWNYDYDGGTEWSFKADTEWGDATFKLMRQYNKKFAEVIPD